MNELNRKNNHTEKYSLDKLSTPSFTLYSNNISVMVNMMEKAVCNMCKENTNEYESMEFYYELKKYKENLYTKLDKNTIVLKKENEDKMDIINRLICGELLSTSCGAEYWLDIASDDISKDIYPEQLKKDFEYYESFIKDT